MTGYASLENAVDLFRLGAHDFIAKPFTFAQLTERVGNALERLRLRQEVKELRAALAASSAGTEPIGTSRTMARLLARLPPLARSSVPVVIYGQTGTGKELVARALHRLSPRAAAPFLAVNCGALPETLLESELFGHRRGAFTDAREDRAGLVATARGGTLFLDEVGDLPIGVQVKLLRFLQEKEYRPLGSSQTLPADVRIVAATHRDLKAAVAEGRFREDLYYRLVVLSIEVPPLAQRREDIPLLVAHFLRIHAPTAPGPVRYFSPLALQRMAGYDWPGNVRELENVVLRAMATVRREVVLPADLDASLGGAGGRGSAGLQPYREAKREAIAAFDRDYVERALAESGGNIAQAARLAGKHPRAFWEIVRGQRRGPADGAEGEEVPGEAADEAATPPKAASGPGKPAG